MLSMGAVVAVSTSVAAEDPRGPTGPAAEDDPGANGRSYLNVWFEDYNLPPVGPGESVLLGFYGRFHINEFDPAYVHGYWQNKDTGEMIGPVYEEGPIPGGGGWGNYWRDYNVPIDAPLQPGKFDMVVLAKDGDWPSPGDYDMRDSTWNTLTVKMPKLEVSHDVPDEVEVGDTFTATASVTNVANVGAPNVEVSQALDGAEVVDDPVASTDQLRAGDTLTLSYEARATELGSIGVSSEAASVITDDLQVTAGPVEGSIDVLGPAISMERDMPDAVNSGEVFQVNVTYTNTGELAAGDVELSDTFDSAYTPVPNGLAVDEPDVPEEPPEEPPSAPSTPGQPGSISPQAPQLDVFEYGQPAAYEQADPITVKGEDTTTFHWGSFELAPGESIEVSYTLVAPLHLPVASVDEPDQPEPPEEPPEEPPVDELPVLPPEEPPEEPPTGPVTVADNDGEYVFTSGVDFTAPSGLGFSSSADADQTVLAVHNTFVEEPEPPEPPEEPPEPPVEP